MIANGISGIIKLEKSSHDFFDLIAPRQGTRCQNKNGSGFRHRGKPQCSMLQPTAAHLCKLLLAHAEADGSPHNPQLGAPVEGPTLLDPAHFCELSKRPRLTVSWLSTNSPAWPNSLPSSPANSIKRLRASAVSWSRAATSQRATVAR